MWKRIGVVMLILASLLTLGFASTDSVSGAAEASEHELRVLEVTGRGQVTAQYDTVHVTVGVTALKDSAPEAYDAMGGSMQWVVKAMRNLGITDEQMKTGVLSLNEEYDYNREGGRTFKGYRASSDLTVTTQKLELAPQIVHAAVGAGANQVQGIRFAVRDTDGLVDQGLDLAVDDARRKAERVAVRLGASVAQVQRVSIMDNSGPIMYAKSERAMAADSGAAPILSGTMDYSVSVSVIFELK